MSARAFYCLALVLLAVLTQASGARAADFGFLASWGSHGQGPGQFELPTGIAVDRAGNVYVADRDDSRVEKFSSDGLLLASWPTSEGQFGANGIAVGPHGDVYVTTYHWIERFTSDGAYLDRWGDRGTDQEFPIPGGAWAVATDANGDVYVLNQNAFEVQKFTADGVFMTAWGSLGWGNGQFAPRDFFGHGQRGPFDGPGGIAVGPDGSVYVSDTWSSRVERFSPNGAYLGQFGRDGGGDGELHEPYGLDVGPDGSVYVADQGNFRIQRFSADGEFLMRWGSPYDDPPGNVEDVPPPHLVHVGEFSEPIWDVAADAAGSVYATDGAWTQSGDRIVQRVQRFGPGGIPPPGLWPLPIAARPRASLEITGRAKRKCPQRLARRGIRDCRGFRYATATWNSGCTGPGVRNGWGLMLRIPDRAVPKPQDEDALLADHYLPPGLTTPVYAPSPPVADDYGALRLPDGSLIGDAARRKSLALASGLVAPGGALRNFLLEAGLRVRPYFRAWCTLTLSNGLTDGQGFDVDGADVATAPYLAYVGRPRALRRGQRRTYAVRLSYESRMAALDRNRRVDIIVTGRGLTRRISRRLAHREPIHVFAVPVRAPRAGRLTIRAKIEGLPLSNILAVRMR